MGKKSILVVEDELDLREALVDAFLDLGYETVGARSGNHALTLLQTQTFDMILSDIMMPDGDGYYLLENLRATGHDSPFLFVTGSEIKDPSLLSRMKVEKVFGKPFRWEELSSTVENILKKL